MQLLSIFDFLVALFVNKWQHHALFRMFLSYDSDINVQLTFVGTESAPVSYIGFLLFSSPIVVLRLFN